MFYVYSIFSALQALQQHFFGGMSFTFFYEILVDSVLATRRIGEQKFSCLQFASSAHNVASEVMETFCIFV